MVELEKVNIPTVTILSNGFQDDAAASAKAFGMEKVLYTVVPRVYNNITHEEADAWRSVMAKASKKGEAALMNESLLFAMSCGGQVLSWRLR